MVLVALQLAIATEPAACRSGSGCAADKPTSLGPPSAAPGQASQPMLAKAPEAYAMGRLLGCGAAENCVKEGEQSESKRMKAPLLPIWSQ